jgi:hypothetical protein
LIPRFDTFFGRISRERHGELSPHLHVQTEGIEFSDHVRTCADIVVDELLIFVVEVNAPRRLPARDPGLAIAVVLITFAALGLILAEKIVGLLLLFGKIAIGAGFEPTTYRKRATLILRR